MNLANNKVRQNVIASLSLSKAKQFMIFRVFSHTGHDRLDTLQ